MFLEQRKGVTLSFDSTTTQLLITPTRGGTEAIRSFLEREFLVTNIESNPDLHWLTEAETAISIDQVRDLAQAVAYVPYGQQLQFYILENLERASIPAQNALLKLIEEPPARTQLLLACASTQAILPTILSRVIIKNLTDAGDNHLSDELATELADFYHQLTTGDLAQLIELAEKSTDRTQASQHLGQLTSWLHQTLQAELNQPTPQTKLALQYTTHIKFLTDTQSLLTQNVNVRLALENCFFKLHQSSHS